MTILDDTALILNFLKGNNTLVANQNLRVEPAFDAVQLLAKRGGLIATLRMLESVPIVTVRRGSEYWNLLHHALVENCFVPLGSNEKQPDFDDYKKQEVPGGYHFNCTEAKVLWQQWWTRTRQGNRHGIQMDLLVFTRNTWYPIREIISNQGTLFISTLATELVYQGTDIVVWLNRLPQAATGKPETQPTPATQSIQPLTDASQSQQHPAVRQLSTRRIAGDRNPLPATKPEHDREPDSQMGSAMLRPDLRSVLRWHQGYLYVKTDIGEVVIEGKDLKFWLSESEPQSQPQFSPAKVAVNF